MEKCIWDIETNREIQTSRLFLENYIIEIFHKPQHQQILNVAAEEGTEKPSACSDIDIDDYGSFIEC